MSDFKLVLGSRNYSSWSLRAWLAMRQTGADFDERTIPLNTLADFFAIAQLSPGRTVPVLQHRDLVIWDSLAIIEYLAEQFPKAGLWPAASDARALARAACAAMHAGFLALRAQMPMNVRSSKPGRGRGEGVKSDIERIVALWRELRARFGREGPYLFGVWSAADVYFAPVVSRFRTYDVELDEPCRAYADAVLAWPTVMEWFAAAATEPWTIEKIDKI
jgi:glutathione S-transferase